MRKIIFHINSLEQGGAERVITNLAHQFAAEGYEVYIATEWYAENEFRIDKSITRVHVGLNAEEEGKGRIAKLRIREKRLRAFIKKVRPDVVVAFCHKANYRAITAALGTGIPVIVSVRTDPVGHYDKWEIKPDPSSVSQGSRLRVPDGRAAGFFSGQGTAEITYHTESAE
ncbi:MAG: glycosyltransferase [Eisenbergiella massiliensis]